MERKGVRRERERERDRYGVLKKERKRIYGECVRQRASV